MAKTKALVKAREAVAITKKMMLVPGLLKAEQLLFIFQKTPAKHIYRRPAKGGGQWEFVTGTYVKKILNYTFGWMWDFEIKEHGKEGELVWVLGRLTIKNKKGEVMITKEQFGRAEVKFKRGTKTPLDYGNDLKAAATDALKKCASELGIASDIYGKEEFKGIQQIDKAFVPPENGEEVKQEIKAGFIAKTVELKKMLPGKTDAEKIKVFRKKTGIMLQDFNITETHASRLIAEFLRTQVKNGK